MINFNTQKEIIQIDFFLSITNKKENHMKQFDYTIKDELGIHARPAGLLVKEAGKFTSVITLKKGDKTADLKRLFAIMGLGVKKADAVTVTVEGEDEDAALEEMKQFFDANL
jgi:phosphocarrier protein HPr